MATLETQQIDEVIANSRRRMLTLGGAALAGIALTSMAQAQTTTLTDTDYLNFALNLEYLEGNYYTLAVSGQTLAGAGIGTSGTGTLGAVTTKPGGPAACQVPFVNTLLASYAAEIASDEQKHINFLRSALGSTSAVAQPAIDLYNSFNTLWTTVLAYFTTNMINASALTQTTFDPFASDINFLLGAYIFETGVGAYSGAAPLLTVAANLNAAAGIQATESYHYGLIRTQIAAFDHAATTLGPAGSASLVTTGISGVRATLDGSASATNLRGDDVGVAGQEVLLNGSTVLQAASIVNASVSYVTTTTNATTGVTTTNATPPSGTSNGSLSQAFTPAQVLAIVYAGHAGGGGFFPSGLNGNIK